MLVRNGLAVVATVDPKDTTSASQFQGPVSPGVQEDRQQALD